MSKARNLADVGSNDVLDTHSTGVDVTGTVTADGGAITARHSTYSDGAVRLNRDLDVSSVGAAGASLKFGAINSGSDVYPVDITGVTDSDGTAGWLTVGMDGSEKMRIDSNGNVDVYQGNDLTWRYAAGSTIRGSVSVDSADNMTFRTGSSNTERMRIDTSGNVGIGTSSPARLLTLSTTDYAPLLVKHTDGGGAYVSFMDNTTTDDTEVLAGAVGNNFVVHAGDTERMRIDSSGRVTMPNQPMFDVAITSSDPTSGDLKFGQVYVNVGSHYSTSTGRFTAPVSGYYEFGYTSIKNNLENTVARLYLKKNGSIIHGNRHLRLDIDQPYGDNGFMLFTVYLNANDYVNVNCGAGSIYNASAEYGIFRGRLLG